MTPAKTKRNKQLVRLVNKGLSMKMVAKLLGLKAKSTVHEIYWREIKRSGKGVDKSPLQVRR